MNIFSYWPDSLFDILGGAATIVLLIFQLKWKIPDRKNLSVKSFIFNYRVLSFIFLAAIAFLAPLCKNLNVENLNINRKTDEDLATKKETKHIILVLRKRLKKLFKILVKGLANTDINTIPLLAS
jgi:hypothetical protein